MQKDIQNLKELNFGHNFAGSIELIVQLPGGEHCAPLLLQAGGGGGAVLAGGGEVRHAVRDVQGAAHGHNCNTPHNTMSLIELQTNHRQSFNNRRRTLLYLGLLLVEITY